MNIPSLDSSLESLLALPSTQPLEENDPTRTYPSNLWATGDFFNDALRAHTPETDDSVDVPSFRAFLDATVREIFLAGALDRVGVILHRKVISSVRKTSVPYIRLHDGRCLLLSQLEATLLTDETGGAA
jgi:hypothetical protein